MECYECGRGYGFFKEVEFITEDGEVKEHRDYCKDCFKRLFPKIHGDKLMIPYIGE